ncbi:glycosyltransferase [Candidatus Pacearchaeota archaeon]|nr:glycosyltransferase [Candidatus Pacearchaeota archaeon]
MKVSIIIPAYNEEKRIGKTLESYSSYFEALRLKKKIDYEFVVVINATKDRTEEIVKKFSKRNSRIKYLNLLKGGKGYAVIEGFRDALKRKSNLIGFVDADMATPPEAFYYLVEHIDSYDGIIASRYIKGSIVKPKPSFSRIISSRIYNILIRTLFFVPYRDTQCGAKLFTRKSLEQTIDSFTMSQWAFDLDVIYHIRKNNFSIKEVPTIWSDKQYSKINFIKAGPKMALGIVRLRLLHSPFKKIVSLYERAKKYLKLTSKAL